MGSRRACPPYGPCDDALQPVEEPEMMKVRYLGHSCVEVQGRQHILIDPDFVLNPDPEVEYICITHAHRDHIGRVAEVPDARVLAAPDVCRVAADLGVPQTRLQPVAAGDRVANINVLPGFSRANDPVYTFFYLLFRRRFPEPGGTPLSFLVEDEATLLHVGDAHEVKLVVRPQILCLPWRRTPLWNARYQARLLLMAEQLGPHYVLPVHHDMPPSDADPHMLQARITAQVLSDPRWYYFRNGTLIL